MPVRSENCAIAARKIAGLPVLLNDKIRGYTTCRLKRYF